MPGYLEHFTDILDNTLKTVNYDYEAKRYKDVLLASPKVELAQQGLFYEGLKERGRLGGQNKVPRLANHREYIDSLLELNKA